MLILFTILKYRIMDANIKINCLVQKIVDTEMIREAAVDLDILPIESVEADGSKKSVSGNSSSSRSRGFFRFFR